MTEPDPEADTSGSSRTGGGNRDGSDQGGGGLTAEVAAAWGELFRFVSSNARGMGVAALVAVFCFGFELFNFSMSIDEELFPDRGNLQQWVSQGRPGVALLKLVFAHDRVVPFFGLFVSLALLVGSAAVWWCAGPAADRRPSRPSDFVAFASLYLTCPTLPYFLSFETYNLEISAGMALTALAALFFARGAVQEQPWTNLLVSGALAAAAFSVYQSLLSLWICGGLFVLLSVQLAHLKDGKTVSRRFLALFALRFTLVTVAALAAYKGLEALGYLFVKKSAYAESFIRWGTTSSREILTSVLQYAISFPLGEAFWGSSRLWATYLVALGLFVWAVSRARSGRAPLGASVALFVLSPLVLVTILGSGVPVRSLQAFPLMLAGVWGFALLACDARLVRRAVQIAVVLLVLRQAQDTNLMFFSENLRWQADRDLANRVLDRIYLLELPSDKPTSVAFVGSIKLAPDRVFIKDEAFGGSFFEWEGGNTWRIMSFVHSMGNQRLQAPSRQQLDTAREVARGMPAWPAVGSVTTRDGLVIVNLSPPS